MNWFKDCTTEAEIKQHWRTLCKQYHPDLGGDTATMQEINAQYEAALKADYTENQGYTAEKAEWRWGLDKEVMEKAVELLKVAHDLKVEICGVWVWITGNTKPARKLLKELGCRWSQGKGCWYWRRDRDGAYKVRRGSLSLEEIRRRYGSYTVEEEPNLSIA